jgi:shikimate kinase
MRRPKPSKSPSRTVAALKRPIVLVGLMGAGKSSIGRLLAARLNLEFVDADAEIENAAHASIEEIFETHGEAAFRSGERRVIARLLAGPVRVVATGGGTFMDNDTRRQIKTLAHSVWLKADLETLLKRVSRREGRPLLKNKDPRAIMAALMVERDPVYAKADITVETSDNPPGEVADRVIKALESHLGVGPLAPTREPGKSRGRAMGNKEGGEAATAAANNTAKPPRRPSPGRRNKRAGAGRGNHRQAKTQPGDRS